MAHQKSYPIQYNKKATHIKHPSLLCEARHPVNYQVQIQLSYTVAARSIPTASVATQTKQAQRPYSLTMMESCNKIVDAVAVVFAC